MAEVTERVRVVAHEAAHHELAARREKHLGGEDANGVRGADVLVQQLNLVVVRTVETSTGTSTLSPRTATSLRQVPLPGAPGPAWLSMVSRVGGEPWIASVQVVPASDSGTTWAEAAQATAASAAPSTKGRTRLNRLLMTFLSRRNGWIGSKLEKRTRRTTGFACDLKLSGLSGLSVWLAPSMRRSVGLPGFSAATTHLVPGSFPSWGDASAEATPYDRDIAAARPRHEATSLPP